MHDCNPAKYRNRFLRLFAMLCNPIKVYSYSIDGEDYCGICRKGILVPYIYYSYLVNCLYILAGIAHEYFVSAIFSPLPRALIRLLSLCIFHHIAAASVFSFFDWEIYDRSKFSPRYANSRALKSSIYKAICFYAGISIIIGARFF